MTEVRISKHAHEQMRERGISEEMVLVIIASPQQTIPDGSDKVIYQAIRFFGKEQKDFLVRVYVNIVKTPNLIITVYRTTKIEKYWQHED